VQHNVERAAIGNAMTAISPTLAVAEETFDFKLFSP